jgi:hypothetical protein
MISRAARWTRPDAECAASARGRSRETGAPSGQESHDADGRTRAGDREPLPVVNHLRSLSFERVTAEDWTIAAVAAVVIFDLLVLPWFSFGATINVGTATVSIGGSLTGADAPDAWLGVLAVMSCAFLLGDLAVERLSPETKVPSLAADRPTTRFVLACSAAALIALKFVFHLGRFGELALGFWLAVLLVAALVALTRRARQGEATGSVVAADPEPRPSPEPEPTPSTPNV